MQTVAIPGPRTDVTSTGYGPKSGGLLALPPRMVRLFPSLVILALLGCEGAVLGGLPMEGAAPVAPGPTTPGSPTQPGPGPMPLPVPELPAFVPAPFRPRLLTSAQYVAAITDLLGVEGARAVTPPRDVPVNGLSVIGAATLDVSSSAVIDYETNAYLAAKAALTARRAALVTCTPASANDAACMRQLAQRFVTRAFRRPATEVELTRWTTIGVDAARGYGQFDRGVEFMLAGLLQSPAFLYLSEVGEADPSVAGRRRLTGWELASRLSFFLVNAPPDDELRMAAANGALETEAGVRAQATRLLAKAEARGAMTLLFDELLELHGLDALAKDRAKFPSFDVALGASMKGETERGLVDVAFDRPGDFRDVLNRKTTFVDAALARHYGLPAVTGWTQVPAPAGRAGVLSQAGFLSLMSHPSANSPTYRGRFVREKLLCQPIPAPPPNVSTTLPEAPPNTRRTLRQKLELHMAAPSCRGCHEVMDPIGFAFEGFDATGRVQTHDDTLPVDTRGSLDEHRFANATEFADLLRDDPRVMECLARQVFRQATGHVDLATEARPLKAVTEAFVASGHRYQTLLVEIAASEAFRSGVEAP